MPREEYEIDGLTRVLMQMSGNLFSEETIQDSLDRICLLMKEAVVGTAGAAVTVVRDDQKFTAALSDEDPVRRADELQYELDEGPCLSAWRDRRPYRIHSMAGEKRWPRWAPAAAGMGIASCVSAPLLIRDHALGAIKVYSRQTNQYAERDERVLQMFADQAAIALSNVFEFADAKNTIAQLKEAIETRDSIGMAKGILMAQEGIDAERAFDMLRVASQIESVKLRDVAQRLVEETARRDSP
jgi:GAF domain-containing protein